MATQITRETELSLLKGLSDKTQRVLKSNDIITVGQLLDLPLSKFLHFKNRQTQDELPQFVADLREQISNKNKQSVYKLLYEFGDQFFINCSRDLLSKQISTAMVNIKHIVSIECDNYNNSVLYVQYGIETKKFYTHLDYDELTTLFNKVL